MAEEAKKLYYGSPRPVRVIEGKDGIVYATNSQGNALMMAISRARGVRSSRIVNDNGTYRLLIQEGYPSQKNVYVYQVSPEGFEPTDNPLILSKRGTVTPIGNVEKIAIEGYKHYFMKE
jgi:hypothetical protein